MNTLVLGPFLLWRLLLYLCGSRHSSDRAPAHPGRQPPDVRKILGILLAIVNWGNCNRRTFFLWDIL